MKCAMKCAMIPFPAQSQAFCWSPPSLLSSAWRGYEMRGSDCSGTGSEDEWEADRREYRLLNQRLARRQQLLDLRDPGGA